MNIEDYRDYCLSLGAIDAATAPDDLLRELTHNSYEIVKAKYKKR
jgi:hypothetical protein